MNLAIIRPNKNSVNIGKILRKNNICDRFDIIFEEKEHRHLHVWIMPRHRWMEEICDDIEQEVNKKSCLMSEDEKESLQFESFDYLRSRRWN